MITYTGMFLIYHLLCTMCYFYYLCHVMKPRKWVKHPFTACFLVFLVFFCYEIVTGDVRSTIRYLLYLISLFLPNILFFESRIRHRVTCTFFYLLVTGTMESLIGSLVWPFLGSLLKLPYDPRTIVPGNEVGALSIYMLSMGIPECAAALFCHKLWHFFSTYLNYRIFVEIGAVCFFIASGAPLAMIDMHSPIVSFLIFFIILLGNLLFIDGIQELLKKAKKSRLDRKREENLTRMLSDYKQIEEESLKLRRIHHDLSNHMQTITELTDTDKTDRRKAKTILHRTL
ncbi:MAG: hypothetical protein Q4B70_01100 [Lachnospiraceae bacterium]|nr:hypothetical protein [Lachnospiraceae bacterium]